jgi:hypothetical protein
MRYVKKMRVSLTLGLSITAALVPGVQTTSGLTLGAQAYDTEAMTKPAFGKLNPNRYGVLPVLLMIRNNTQKTVNVTGLRATYVDLDRNKIEATPAGEVKYANAPDRPRLDPGPIPPMTKPRVKKNPLAATEIDERGFAARMLPPGESAYGFLYFQTSHRSGAKLFIDGLTDAATGQEFFYFELPLTEASR